MNDTTCLNCKETFKTKAKYNSHKKKCDKLVEATEIDEDNLIDYSKKYDPDFYDINEIDFDDKDDYICAKHYKNIEFITAFIITQADAEKLMRQKLTCTSDLDATLQYIKYSYPNPKRYMLYVIHPLEKTIYYYRCDKWLSHKQTDKPVKYINKLHKLTCVKYDFICNYIYEESHKLEHRDLILGVYENTDYNNYSHL
jgi:hypothetical protein